MYVFVLIQQNQNIFNKLDFGIYHKENNSLTVYIFFRWSKKNFLSEDDQPVLI